jgi:hypothetical protein
MTRRKKIMAITLPKHMPVHKQLLHGKELKNIIEWIQSGGTITPEIQEALDSLPEYGTRITALESALASLTSRVEALE